MGQFVGSRLVDNRWRELPTVEAVNRLQDFQGAALSELDRWEFDDFWAKRPLCVGGRFFSAVAAILRG